MGSNRDYDIYLNGGTPLSWLTPSERYARNPWSVSQEELIAEDLERAGASTLPPIVFQPEKADDDTGTPDAIPFSPMAIVSPRT